MANPRSMPKGFATIGLCFATALLEGLDLQSMGIAASGIRAEFELAPAMLGWLFSVGLIGLLPGALLGGWLADRIGRKTVLIWAVVLFGIFSLGTAYAWNYPTLLAARLMTGIGMGAALPILIAVASEAVVPAIRNTAVSLTYCGVPLGGALASVIGITEYGTGWRTVFYVGGVTPLVVALMLLVFLPNSTSVEQHAVSPSPTAPEHGISGLFTEGRWRSTLLLWIGCFFTLTVLYTLLNWLPSLLTSQGLSHAQAATVQILFNLGGALGTVVTGRLIDRSRPIFAVLAAYGGLLLALGGLGMASAFGVMLVVGFVAGYCALGAQLVLYAKAPAMYPPPIRATGVGAAVAFGRLGSAAGPLVAGQVLATGAGTFGVMIAALPGLVVAGLCAISLSRKRCPLLRKYHT